MIFFYLGKVILIVFSGLYHFLNHNLNRWMCHSNRACDAFFVLGSRVTYAVYHFHCWHHGACGVCVWISHMSRQMKSILYDDGTTTVHVFFGV